jgi:hypothetical protein
LRVGEHAGALWRPLTGVPSAGRADFPGWVVGRTMILLGSMLSKRAVQTDDASPS